MLRPFTATTASVGAVPEIDSVLFSREMSMARWTPPAIVTNQQLTSPALALEQLRAQLFERNETDSCWSLTETIF